MLRGGKWNGRLEENECACVSKRTAAETVVLPLSISLAPSTGGAAAAAATTTKG